MRATASHHITLSIAIATAIASAPAAQSGHSPAPEYYATAREAIGGTAALSHIRSVHVTAELIVSGTSSGAAGTGGSRTMGIEQIWLEPPARVLQALLPSQHRIDDDAMGDAPPLARSGFGGMGFMRRGLDHGRVITSGPLDAVAAFMAHRALERFALAWLLPDPDSLGMRMADEGTATVDGKAVHVLRATDDSGFEVKLYYEVASHRLVMSDDVTLPPYRGTAMSHPGQPPMPAAPEQPNLENVVVERYTYGEYRRVQDIFVPHAMTRVIRDEAGAPGPIQFLHVVAVKLNPSDLEKQFR